MSVTIKDVAKKAKVAPSTVSRVISDSPRISQQTKEKVRLAMTELGYHPNYHARSLVNQSTRTLGVIMPSSPKGAFQNPFFSEVLRGITAKASVDKFGLYLSTGQSDDEIYDDVQQMVFSRRIDGIILLYSKMNDRIIPFLLKEKFPFVLVGRPADQFQEQVYYVNNDNFKASKMVTEYLLLLGHKRIGFIGGELDQIVTVDHQRGYESALEHSDIPVNKKYLIYNNEGVLEDSQESLIELMAHKPSPTALVVADDLMALSVLRLLNEMGLRVPEDMSIVSFNNIMLSQLTLPPLTTVDIHIYELGFIGTEKLINMINQKEQEKETIIPYRFIKRQTCKKQNT
ncbi:putative transcriptional regulator [Bacillus sp. TS-2]|nr:putative transcriptional regulator [Bacillus sp. TS-2]